MSLDAIFFDVDDTLFSTSEFAARARRAACEAMVEVGLRMDVDDVETELLEVVAEFTSNYENHFDQLLRRIPARTFKGVNRAILVAAGVKAYHDTKLTDLKPYPDAVALLQDLAGLDLIRGVITSGRTVKQAEKLLRLELYPYLTPTAIYISAQIGINKPNVKLWRRACSDLNLKPSHCIYVGDRLSRDIDPANALGMETVHLKRGGKHQGEVGDSPANHTIEHFDELRALLIRDHGLDLPPAGSSAAP